jgi:hypothetical protein
MPPSETQLLFSPHPTIFFVGNVGFESQLNSRPILSHFGPFTAAEERDDGTAFLELQQRRRSKSKRSRMWRLPADVPALLGLAFFVGGVGAGDAGDDFSNNLFSDLAPLLALFGERVTMQFMSQSMGWSDNVVLAMCPVGIITAVVGAIRTGGPPWLKTLIGRARESKAIAEQELMSSTSKEVCELWNGSEIVRVMGNGPIREFIVFIPPGALEEMKCKPVRVAELKDMEITGKYLEEYGTKRMIPAFLCNI